MFLFIQKMDTVMIFQYRNKSAKIIYDINCFELFDVDTYYTYDGQLIHCSRTPSHSTEWLFH